MLSLQVVLYGRQGCCLCDDAARMIDELRGEFPFSLRKVDIDQQPQWSGLCCQIPVVTVDGGNRVALRVTPARLRRAFERAHARRLAAGAETEHFFGSTE